MTHWLWFLVLWPVLIACSMLGGVRRALRAWVVRYPQAAARSFISLAIGFFVAWLLDVPLTLDFHFVRR